ncbi:S-layer homology domain-containing protein [Candidatus Peregrinibacteria bacterium]|nr:S-layer homology domain-containing protein [Candidatus Peregrinibacteria bacterium]
MKKLAQMSLLIFSLLLSNTVILAAQQDEVKKSFGFDIPENHRNIQAIQYLNEKEIVSGYPDGSFKPEQTVNRAEELKILIEGQGITPDPETFKNCFPDVKDEWFAKYVCYAKEKEWIEGYPDGTFKPEQTVNKVEAIKMVVETREELKSEIPEVVPEEIYEDTDREAWYAPYVYVAKKKAILEETGSVLKPTEGMKRAGISENIFRSMKMKEGKKEKYEGVEYEELFVPKRAYDVQAKVLTPPKQYFIGSNDVSMLDFSITANKNITIEVLSVGFTAIPTAWTSYAREGNLINEIDETANFTDFKISDKDTGVTMLNPAELNTTVEGNNDLEQILTFNGAWSIQKGTTVRLSMTADIKNLEALANNHFYGTLVNLKKYSAIYDEKHNRVDDIFPERDIKGGLITPRMQVNFSVSLSPSQPASFIVPSNATHMNFMNIDFAADSGDDVQIKGLKLAMKGNAIVKDLFLYDGDVRLTTAANIDNINRIVSFDSLDGTRTQVIMPNEKITYSVIGSIGESSDGATIQFELTDASFLRVSAPEISASFPLVSNMQTIEGTITESFAVSKKDISFSPRAGEKEAKVAAFTLSPSNGSSGILLDQVILRYMGDVPMAEYVDGVLIPQIENYVLKHNGNTIATTQKHIDKVSYVLIPFKLNSQLLLNSDEDFEVFVDIGENADDGESLVYYLDDPTDIVAYNANGYGVPVMNNYDNREWYSSYSSWSRIGEDSTKVPPVEPNEITISHNQDNPTSPQTVAPGQHNVNFLIFDLENTGSDPVDITGFTFYKAGAGKLADLQNILFERYDTPGKYIIQARRVDEETATIQFEDFRIYLEKGKKASVRVYADIAEKASDGSDYSLELTNVVANNSAAVTGVPLKGDWMFVDTEAPEPSEIELSLSSNNPKDKSVHGGQQDEPLIIFDALNAGPRDIVITDLAFYRSGSGTSNFDDFTDFSIEITSRSVEVAGRMVKDSNGQDSVKFENLSISLNSNEKIMIYFWADINENAVIGNTHNFKLYDVNAYAYLGNEGNTSEVAL